jgi:signal peptidase I
LIRRLFALPLLFTLAVVLLVVFVVRFYTVAAPSMEPTLRRGDHVLALRWSWRSLERGDVVALKLPPRARALCGVEAGVFLKRIIGMSGDRVAERRGRVVLNGSVLREPYARRDAQTVPARRVPSDSYWVLGDNRASSCDSRVWGPLPKRDVLGRVVATFWPPTRIGVR